MAHIKYWLTSFDFLQTLVFNWLSFLILLQTGPGPALSKLCWKPRPKLDNIPC